MTFSPANFSPLDRYRQRAEAALARRLPLTSVSPTRLHEAMRYVVLEGGKRVRPALCYAAGATLGLAPDQLDTPACALELIHAYSLVHDDLPAMDDDDLRRGRPTCHKAYDEATAILVGDALQALSFQVLAEDWQLPAEPRAAMILELAQASGSLGMVGGQSLDLAGEGKTLSLVELEQIHRLKTGALIRTAVTLPLCLVPQAAEATRQALHEFGTAIGLAFQIQDDILDVTGSTEVLGKRQGADQRQGKATYPALLGLDEAHRRLQQAHTQAIASLDPFGAQAAPLLQLADFLLTRVS